MTSRELPARLARRGEAPREGTVESALRLERGLLRLPEHFFIQRIQRRARYFVVHPGDQRNLQRTDLIERLCVVIVTAHWDRSGEQSGHVPTLLLGHRYEELSRGGRTITHRRDNSVDVFQLQSETGHLVGREHADNGLAQALLAVAFLNLAILECFAHPGDHCRASESDERTNDDSDARVKSHRQSAARGHDDDVTKSRCCPATITVDRDRHPGISVLSDRRDGRHAPMTSLVKPHLPALGSEVVRHPVDHWAVLAGGVKVFCLSHLRTLSVRLP